MTFRIVTVTSGAPQQDYFCYDEFFKSIRNQGIEPLVLGGFLGLGTKAKLLYNAINNGQITEDITIFVDCYDLIFVRPITELVELFKTKDADVIISTEINCFPHDYKENMDEMGQGYLNSGFIIGYTDKVKLMLEAMDAANIPNDYHDESGWHHFNDQTLFQKVYTEQPVKIKLDTHSEMCQCLYGVYHEDMILEAGKIFIKEGMKEPYVLHWNGGAKTLSGSMKPVLNYLNLR